MGRTIGSVQGSAPVRARVTGIVGDAQPVDGAIHKPVTHAVAAGEGEQRTGHVCGSVNNGTVFHLVRDHFLQDGPPYAGHSPSQHPVSRNPCEPLSTEDPGPKAGPTVGRR